jgi:CubicO group peptidase (beta-lactamase class C family)
MFADFERQLAEHAAFIPGSTIAWTAIDGERVTTGTCGAEPAPRFFAIGSITKVFTGMLVDIFAQRGLLGGETRLGELLPQARLGKAVAHITLRELQTHTSGLPRLPLNTAKDDLTDPYAGYAQADLIAALETLSDGQIIDGRGVKEYSNFGGGVLGNTLALAAGTPYGDLLEREIFAPLGMHDTFIATAATLAERAPGLGGHDADGDACPAWTFGAMAPAGGAVSTIADMTAFANALLHDERLGLTTNASWVESGAIRWHNGQTRGHHAMIAFDVSARSAAIALWNAAYGIDTVCLRALRPGYAVAALPITAGISAAAIAAFAGTYAADNATLQATAHGERLRIRSTLINGAFYPLGDDAFFSKNLPDHILTFGRDAVGMVDRLEVTHYGMTIMRLRRNF